MSAKLTPQQHKALKWFRANEPVSAFPCDGSGPSLKFVRRLKKLGLVHEVGREAGGFLAFTKYAMTDAGRLAIEENSRG